MPITKSMEQPTMSIYPGTNDPLPLAPSLSLTSLEKTQTFSTSRGRSSLSNPPISLVTSDTSTSIDESQSYQRNVLSFAIVSNSGFQKNKPRTLSSKIAILLGEPEDVDPNVLSIQNPESNLFRVTTASLWIFVVGMSDGCVGALLPSIEKYYNISYAIVSLIWLGNALGFIIIAFTAHTLQAKFGKHTMLTVSALCFTICYAIVCSGLPFEGVVIGFFFAGLGGAIGHSQYNIFLSKLLNGSKYLGIVHGIYGIGATVSPLIGTAMLDQGIVWHYYFFIPLAMSMINVGLIFLAFKGCDEDLQKWEHLDNADTQKDKEKFDIEMEVLPNTQSKADFKSLIEANDIPDSEEEEEEETHDFKSAFVDYRTWLVCIFIFFYQGAEVSMGGWIVTFLLEYRKSPVSSTGYVSSGFWGGVALGRLFLTHNLCRLFSVRRSILIISLLIIVLDILAWLVPSIIASAVFASLIGLLIGPIYPMMVTLVTRILPRKIKFCAMTLGTAFGSSGGSAIPFAIGIASQFSGTWILHPIFLACYAIVVVSWVAMPNLERRGVINNFWQRLW